MDNEKYVELEQAAREVARYLKVEGETEYRNALYPSPSQSLRAAADEMDKKHAAIYRFRNALLALEK